MGAENAEFWLKVCGALSIMANIVVVLAGYIWKNHVREMREAKKSIANLVSDQAFKEAKQSFERKVSEMREQFDKRVNEIERRQRDEVESLREEMREDVTALRNDMNGMAIRLSQQMARTEAGIIRQVDEVGKSFSGQMALLVKLVESLKKND